MDRTLPTRCLSIRVPRPLRSFLRLPPRRPPTMRRARPLLLLASVACASKVPRVPGPLGSVGRDAPPVAVLRPLEVFEEVGEQLAPAPPPPPRRSSPTGDRIAEAASHYLEHRPRGFRDDCSGFVMAALDRAGLPVQGNTRSLWDLLREQGLTHRHKVPAVGDLAFFDNTYDRDRNGRFDDDLTHIGVVIDVDGDDTITIAHAGTSRGRTVLTMNLRDPDIRRTDDGVVRNDYLRREKQGDPRHAKYLAGQLWRGFATVQEDGLAAVSER